MAEEYINLVEPYMKDVQDEGTERHHAVQDYMKVKKKEILQRVTELGKCRITSMWKNLTTLQPMVNDILKEIPETEVNIEINIVQKLNSRSSVAIFDADMEGRKHNIDEAVHGEAPSSPSQIAGRGGEGLKRKGGPNPTSDHDALPEKKQCKADMSSPSGITQKATPTAAVEDGCGVLMRPWLLAMKLEVYEEKAKIWIAENGPCDLNEVASS